MTAPQPKAFFEEQGYLTLEGLLDARTLDACQKEVRRLHQVAADLEKAGSADSRDFQREPYADGANNVDGLPVLRKVEETLKYSPLFKDIAATPRLVQTVQMLLDSPDLLQFRSTLMLKPAFHGSIHALHQDSSYWPVTPPSLITVSIALSDSTPENGCFQVIPGSHKWGLQKWGNIATKQDGKLTDRTDIDTSGLVEVPLKAGTALLFHSLLVHGSGPNRSPNPRNTALYAYLSPKVRYSPGPGQPREHTYRVISGMNGAATYTMRAETPAAV